MGLLAEYVAAQQGAPTKPPSPISLSTPEFTPDIVPDDRTGTGLAGFVGNFFADVKDIGLGLARIGGYAIGDVADYAKEAATLGGADTTIEVLRPGFAVDMVKAVGADLNDRYLDGDIQHEVYDHPLSFLFDALAVAGAGGAAARATAGQGMVGKAALGMGLTSQARAAKVASAVEDIRLLRQAQPLIDAATPAAAGVIDAGTDAGRLARIKGMFDATPTGEELAATDNLNWMPVDPAYQKAGIESIGELVQRVQAMPSSMRRIEKLLPNPSRVADPVSGATVTVHGSRNPLVRAAWTDPIQRRALTYNRTYFEAKLARMEREADMGIAAHTYELPSLRVALDRMRSQGAQLVATPVYARNVILRKNVDKLVSSFVTRGIVDRQRGAQELGQVLEGVEDPESFWQQIEGLSNGTLNRVTDEQLQGRLTQLGYATPEDAARDALYRTDGGRMNEDVRATLVEQVVDGRIRLAETYRYEAPPELVDLPERQRFEGEMRAASVQAGIPTGHQDFYMNLADSSARVLSEVLPDRYPTPDAVYATMRMEYLESIAGGEGLAQRVEAVSRRYGGAISYRGNKPYLNARRLADQVLAGLDESPESREWWQRGTQAAADITAGRRTAFRRDGAEELVDDFDIFTDLLAVTSLGENPKTGFASALRIYEALKKGDVERLFTPDGHMIDPDTGKRLTRSKTSQNVTRMVREIVDGHGVRRWEEEVAGADLPLGQVLERFNHRTRKLTLNDRQKVRAMAANLKGIADASTNDRRIGLAFGIFTGRQQWAKAFGPNESLWPTGKFFRRIDGAEYRRVDEWMRAVRDEVNLNLPDDMRPLSVMETQSVLWSRIERFMGEELALWRRKMKRMPVGSPERVRAEEYAKLLDAAITGRTDSTDFLGAWDEVKDTAAGQQFLRNVRRRMGTTTRKLSQQLAAEIKGQVVFGDDFSAVVSLARSGDFTTLVHEHAHMLRRMLPAEEVESLWRYYSDKVKPPDGVTEVLGPNGTVGRLYQAPNRSLKGRQRWASVTTQANGEMYEGQFVVVKGSGQFSRATIESMGEVMNGLEPAADTKFGRILYITSDGDPQEIEVQARKLYDLERKTREAKDALAAYDGADGDRIDSLQQAVKKQEKAQLAAQRKLDKMQANTGRFTATVDMRNGKTSKFDIEELRPVAGTRPEDVGLSDPVGIDWDTAGVPDAKDVGTYPTALAAPRFETYTAPDGSAYRAGDKVTWEDKEYELLGFALAPQFNTAKGRQLLDQKIVAQLGTRYSSGARPVVTERVPVEQLLAGSRDLIDQLPKRPVKAKGSEAYQAVKAAEAEAKFKGGTGEMVVGQEAYDIVAGEVGKARANTAIGVVISNMPGEGDVAKRAAFAELSVADQAERIRQVAQGAEVDYEARGAAVSQASRALADDDPEVLAQVEEWHADKVKAYGSITKTKAGAIKASRGALDAAKDQVMGRRVEGWDGDTPRFAAQAAQRGPAPDDVDPSGIPEDQLGPTPEATIWTDAQIEELLARDVEWEAGIEIGENVWEIDPRDEGALREFVYRDPDSDEVLGSLTVYDNGGGDGELSVMVHPKVRRQGVATMLYDMAEEAGIPVRELSGTGMMSEAGAGFSHKYLTGEGPDVDLEEPATPPPSEPPVPPAGQEPPDMAWTREMEEAFAEDFERWVFNKIEPEDVRVLPGFRALREALAGLWQSVRGFTREQQLVPGEAAAVFDRYFGGTFDELNDPQFVRAGKRRTRAVDVAPLAGPPLDLVPAMATTGPEIEQLARVGQQPLRTKLGAIFGRKGFTTRVKSLGDIERKLKSGLPVTDALGGRVIIDSWADADNVPARLAEQGLEVIGVLDHRGTAGDFGKRGVWLAVRDAETGAVAELEVGTPLFNRFRESTFVHEKRGMELVASQKRLQDEIGEMGNKLIGHGSMMGDAPGSAGMEKRLADLERQLEAVTIELGAARRYMEGFYEMLVDEIDGNYVGGPNRNAINELRLWNARHVEADLFQRGYWDFRYAFERLFVPIRKERGAFFDADQNDWVGGGDPYEIDNARAAAGLPMPVYFAHIEKAPPLSDFVTQRGKALLGARKMADNPNLRRIKGTLEDYNTNVREVYMHRMSRAIKMRDTFEMVEKLMRTYGRPIPSDGAVGPGEGLVAPDFMTAFFKIAIGLEDRMADLLQKMPLDDLLVNPEDFTRKSGFLAAGEIVEQGLKRTFNVEEVMPHALMKALEDTMPQTIKELVAITKRGVDLYALPKAVLDRIDASLLPQFNKNVRLWWDTPTNMWRSVTLYGRPAWVANNVAGNVSFLKIQGGRFMDVIRQMYDPEFRDMAKQLADQVPGSDVGFIGSQVEQYQAHLGSATSEAGAEAVNTLRVAAAGVKGYNVLKRYGDFMKYANTTVENYFRRASLIRAGEQIADEVDGTAMRSFAHRIWTDKKEMERALIDGVSPERAEAMLERVNTFFGDFSSLGPTERRLVRRFLFPFYGFYKHVVSLFVKLPSEYPGRFAVIRGMTELTEDMREEYGPLPEWMDGMVPFGPFKADGTTQWMSTGGPNPFNVLTDSGLSMLHPVWKVLIEQSTGRDSFTGRPFTDPNVVRPFGSDIPYRIIRDESGRPIDAVPVEKVTPGPLVHLLSQVPQYDLLKNMLAGGRSYDTQGILGSILGGPVTDSAGETVRPTGVGESVSRYLGLSTFPFDVGGYQDTAADVRQQALTAALKQWQAGVGG